MIEGMIAYFHLEDWWLSAFNDAERQRIESCYGQHLTHGKISFTSQTAIGLLRAMASFWKPTPEDAILASRLRAKANEIATGKFFDDFWTSQIEYIAKLWRKNDYDEARTSLHDLSYKIREEHAPQPIPELFNTLMVAFTRDDPLYADVMRVALPVIEANPGIVQSALSKQFPQFDAEQFRYAMYYGEAIGDVLRNKKGSSYSLSLPDIMPPLQKWETPNTNPLIEAQQRRSLHDRRQLEELSDFRPFWQLVGQCAGSDGKKTYLAKDAYWQTACVPWNCTKLGCRCRVDSLTRTELARYVESGCENDPAAVEFLKTWGWK